MTNNQLQTKSQIGKKLLRLGGRRRTDLLPHALMASIAVLLAGDGLGNDAGKGCRRLKKRGDIGNGDETGASQRDGGGEGCC